MPIKMQDKPITVQGVAIKVIKTPGQKDLSAPIAFGAVQIFRIDLTRITKTFTPGLAALLEKQNPAVVLSPAIVRSLAIRAWPWICQAIPQNEFDSLFVHETDAPIKSDGTFTAVIFAQT